MSSSRFPYGIFEKQSVGTKGSIALNCPDREITVGTTSNATLAVTEIALLVKEFFCGGLEFPTNEQVRFPTLLQLARHKE
ncbi:hypothetical protein GIB67_012697 [Kingdonia uniflora]|uniref:Uncharacterized protein n=1 Tax=Kingdonia uniflora TaxID=39325 RepID=A0A7J7NFM4_9MAGN|nr:hypothetical protein GIB67_012697 [Kingdonia uniflora]